MNQYLFLLHEKPADAADLSPAQLQEIIQRYKAWSADMAQRGLLSSGHKLTDDGGRLLRLQGGKPLATDGPYAEAHDIVGGIFMINAESDAHAEALALTCPHLAGSQWIEIRKIDSV
jgi:hypothetical protein